MQLPRCCGFISLSFPALSSWLHISPLAKLHHYFHSFYLPFPTTKSPFLTPPSPLPTIHLWLFHPHQNTELVPPPRSCPLLLPPKAAMEGGGAIHIQPKDMSFVSTAGSLEPLKHGFDFFLCSVLSPASQSETGPGNTNTVCNFYVQVSNRRDVQNTLPAHCYSHILS